MQDIAIAIATSSQITDVWRRCWGLPIVTRDRVFSPSDVQGIVALDEKESRLGLLTVYVEGKIAEIVTLDSFDERKGVGSALLFKAEQELSAMGVEKIRLVTTNDNLRALRFYLKRGYRLVAVHLDAMDRVRSIKPSVERMGLDGLPLLDMWELEKRLPRKDRDAHLASNSAPEPSADGSKPPS